jgi:hypothetical protein
MGMLKLSVIAVVVLIGLCLGGCPSPYATHTGPPPRTVPLDSIKGDADGYHWSKAPDSVEVKFAVTHEESCRVKITVHRTSTKPVTTVVDSVYAPGEYTIWYNLTDSNGVKLGRRNFFYKFDVCDSVYTHRLDNRIRYE